MTGLRFNMPSVTHGRRTMLVSGDNLHTSPLSERATASVAYQSIATLHVEPCDGMLYVTCVGGLQLLISMYDESVPVTADNYERSNRENLGRVRELAATIAGRMENA